MIGGAIHVTEADLGVLATSWTDARNAFVCGDGEACMRALHSFIPPIHPPKNFFRTESKDQQNGNARKPISRLARKHPSSQSGRQRKKRDRLFFLSASPQLTTESAMAPTTTPSVAPATIVASDKNTPAAVVQSSSVTVHPLVLLSVVDHYNRVAKNTKKRALGVLLGQAHGNKVNVANSFAGKDQFLSTSRRGG